MKTNIAKNVLKYFLFSCYSGLRYQYIRNLKHKNIQEGMIYIVMHKTKDIIRIPLIDKAMKLIKLGFEDQKIFKILSGQPTNRYLKDIMNQAGINKNISFHCARHTFAAIALNKGIPIEVVRTLLGHKNFKTTQIYAKVVDSYKIKEMKKWETSELFSKDFIIS